MHVTGNTMELGHHMQPRSSVWGPLLWKEWRQQRAAALLLGLFCLVGYLAASSLLYWDPGGIVLAFLLPVVTLCLATNAFTAELDDRTGHFVWQLPIPAWNLLGTKYLATMGVAVLCLLPCLLAHVVLVLVNQPNALRWFVSRSGQMAFFMTAAIALAGALARQGWGGMGTLLASGALGGMAILAYGRGVQYAGRVLIATADRPWFPFAFWALVHLWFALAWLRKREGNPSWRKAAAWSLALLILPFVPVCTRVVRAEIRLRTNMPFERWIRISRARTSLSPDGRKLLIGCSLHSRIPISNSSLWLVDIETGEARRMGHRLEPGSQVHWSPDGKRIVIYRNPDRKSYPVFETEGEEAVEQWVVDAASGDIQKGESHPGAHVISWLKDGTQAVCTPTAWEFTDGTSGETQRCLHPPKSDAVGQRFYKARSSHRDHSIYASFMDRSGDTVTCHVWRSAPGLSQAERRDYRLKLDLSDIPEEFLPARMSPDAQWLLFTLFSTERHPYWLMSLADGTCHRLEPVGTKPKRIPRFTPDSGLLLVRRDNLLNVLDLVTLHWREPILFPAVAHSDSGPIVATSAEHPHMLAVAVRAADVLGGVPAAAFVIDLDKGTSAEVMSMKGSLAYVPDQFHVLRFDDRLLLERLFPYGLWTVNVDGSDLRQVLP